ncbi:MAG: tetratricopeptide repeat protein [Nostoc sp.]|uniref:tetratricopeptide repeat protein n=1 Tax=Nostoc sp. TaxID=1180 RepID=UPI002FF67510
MAQSIPFSPTLQLITSVKDAIAHLAEIAQNLTDAVSGENLIWVFVGLDRFYSGQGLYAIAEPWCQQCVSVVQTRLGEEHPSVATSYNNLGLLYDSQGRYSEAEPLYKKALSIAELSLGVDHPRTATIRKNLKLLGDNYT